MTRSTPTLRLFEPTDAPTLTDFLHRAYAELGERGLNFTAVDQDVETTLFRAAKGRCWIAVDADRVVGTLTVSLPPGRHLDALTPVAGQAGAWLNQMAVDPDRRGEGIAATMWQTGLAWAAAQGVTAIGVDTAVPATHLQALYARWGFVPRGTIQWPGKTYESTVMLRDVTLEDR